MFDCAPVCAGHSRVHDSLDIWVYIIEQYCTTPYSSFMVHVIRYFATSLRARFYEWAVCVRYGNLLIGPIWKLLDRRSGISDLGWIGSSLTHYIWYTQMCRSDGSLFGKNSLNMGMVLCWKTPKHGSYFSKTAKKKSRFLWIFQEKTAKLLCFDGSCFRQNVL